MQISINNYICQGFTMEKWVQLGEEEVSDFSRGYNRLIGGLIKISSRAFSRIHWNKVEFRS